MQELHDLERFEMKILELLNRIRVIDQLYFGGGTMLRLCHNLNRYSTDLDFWIKPGDHIKSIYHKILTAFSEAYSIKDAEDKTNTLLFEIHSPESVRNLKVEIRKDQTSFDWERRIAFSPFSNSQVVVRALSLEQMMKNKCEAFLNRKLIRDCFDIEFLLYRGIKLKASLEEFSAMIAIIEKFKERDFKVTLGSLLEEKDREFSIQNQFQFLKEEIHRNMNID